MSISRLIDVILRKKDTDDYKIKISRFVYIGESIFKGEIKNKQEKYVKNSILLFLNPNFLAIQNLVILQQKLSAKHSSFPLNTFHLDDTTGNVTSFCGATIYGNIQNAWNIHNISTDLGKIHGRNVKTNWFEWSWKIPESAPRGDYRVIIGLWSDSQDENEDKSIPFQFCERSFYVMDSDASRYQ